MSDNIVSILGDKMVLCGGEVISEDAIEARKEQAAQLRTVVDAYERGEISSLLFVSLPKNAPFHIDGFLYTADRVRMVGTLDYLKYEINSLIFAECVEDECEPISG